MNRVMFWLFVFMIFQLYSRFVISNCFIGYGDGLRVGQGYGGEVEWVNREFCVRKILENIIVYIMEYVEFICCEMVIFIILNYSIVKRGIKWMEIKQFYL